MKRKTTIISLIILMVISTTFIIGRVAYLNSNQVKNIDKKTLFMTDVYFTDITFPTCNSECCENIQLIIKPSDYEDEDNTLVITADNVANAGSIEVRQGMFEYYDVVLYSPTTEKKVTVDNLSLKYIDEDNNTTNYYALNYVVDETQVCPVSTKTYEITKKWIDNENAYSTRPTDIEFMLYTEEGTIEGETCTANAETNWKCTITQDFYDTTPETIRIYENTNNNSTFSYNYICDNCQKGNRTQTNEDSTTSTISSYYIELGNNNVESETSLSTEFNNLLYGEKQIMIQKSWSDNGDTLGKRPDSIDVVLKQDGVDYQTLTLTNSSWSYGPIKVPIYDNNGKLIEYTLEEKAVPYYEKVDYEYLENSQKARVVYSGDTYNITNSLSYNEDITITKKWLDGDNEYNVRPSKVEVTLYQNEKEYQVIELTGSTSTWTKTISVPKYDSNQNEYSYTIKEKSFELQNEEYNYTSKVDGLTITNELNKNLTIKKKWQDNSNAYQTRPPTIKVNLLQNNNEYKELTLEGNTNEWTTDVVVPMYNEINEKYTYTIKETTPSEYKATYNDLTITNTLSKEVPVTINKEWYDNSNKYNTRPESVEVTLKQNDKDYKTITITSDNNWVAEDIVIPKYDENGVKYKYTLEEKKVKEYDLVQYEYDGIELANNTDGTTNQRPEFYRILNVLNTEEELNITKKWLDGDNEYNVRPSKVEVIIYQNNKEYQTVELTGSTNTWTKTISVPKYDEEQEKYTYTIKEKTIELSNNDYSYKTTIEDFVITNTLNKKITITKEWIDNDNSYTTRPTEIELKLLQNNNEYKNITLSGDTNKWTNEVTVPLYSSNNEKYKYTLKENAVSGYKTTYNQETLTVTNALTASKEIVITKKWLDNSNLYNTRPQSIEVVLKQNEEEYKRIIINGEKDTWESQPVEIPTYDSSGKKYTYTIEESKVNYYKTTYDQNEFTITNTLSHDETITITKKWLDGNNKYNVRPAEIEIILYQNNQEFATLKLKGETNTWSITKEVPVYDENQIKYKYTIKEKAISLDNKDYSYKSEINNFNITNTLNKNIVITKKWVDNNNAYLTRPTSVSVILLQNNKDYENITIAGSASNNEWTSNIKIPLFNEKDEEYKYTLNELKISDYKSTYNSENLTITNTLSVEKEVTITKNWYDNNNEYKTRPTSLKIELKQDGKKYKDIILSGTTNTWKSEKILIPTYDEEGHKYTYTISEETISNYGIVTYNQEDLTVTNKLKENTNLVITKKWIDNSNAYQTRPEEIKITLLQNNKEYKNLTLTGETNEWTTNIEVPVYDENQVKYIYSIKEQTDNLNSDYSNITYSKEELSVINKLEKEISITITKAWNDEDNKYKTRPTKINVNLLQNGKLYKELEITSSDKWKKTIEELPLYDEAGKKNTYTIEEITNIKYYKNITYDQTEYKIINELTEKPKVKLYFDVVNGYTKPKEDEIKFDKEGFKEVLDKYNLDIDDEYTYPLIIENTETKETIEGKLSTKGTLEFNDVPYGEYILIVKEDEYFDFDNMNNLNDIPGVTFTPTENGGKLVIEPTGKDIEYRMKVVNKITKLEDNPETKSGIVPTIIVLILSLITYIIMSRKVKKEII